MSYLPRMSKTYKEPQAQVVSGEPEDILMFGTLQPASSLASEKTFNPQIALKHYKYHPHPLPVLPGPSVADEANENELFREASRLRRSLSKAEDLAKSVSRISLEETTTDSSQVSFADETPSEKSSDPPKRIHFKKQSPQKSNRVLVTRKKSSKLSIDKRKDSFRQFASVSFVEVDTSRAFLTAQSARSERNLTDVPGHSDLAVKAESGRSLRRERTGLAGEGSKSVLSLTTEKVRKPKSPSQSRSRHFVSKGAQCAIFGGPDKTFVIPPAVSVLLKMLAFLLNEVTRDDVVGRISDEGKRVMTHVQLILGDLCNQSSSRDVGFDLTYSDSKRMEKTLEDLQKYLRTVYGDKGEFVDKAQGLKRNYIDLKMKELELILLYNKTQEEGNLFFNDVELRDSDLKNPAVTLQNRKLEKDQLLAEVEFSGIELRKLQKTLAEVEWDIKTSQDQVNVIRKTSGVKSKPEVLARKPSLQRFTADAKASRGKDAEEHGARKKT